MVDRETGTGQYPAHEGAVRDAKSESGESGDDVVIDLHRTRDRPSAVAMASTGKIYKMNICFYYQKTRVLPHAAEHLAPRKVQCASRGLAEEDLGLLPGDCRGFVDRGKLNVYKCGRCRNYYIGRKQDKGRR
jgi:hypothetical protein